MGWRTGLYNFTDPHPLYCRWFAERRESLNKNPHYYYYYYIDFNPFPKADKLHHHNSLDSGFPSNLIANSSALSCKRVNEFPLPPPFQINPMFNQHQRTKVMFEQKCRHFASFNQKVMKGSLLVPSLCLERTPVNHHSLLTDFR
jgi:hypothetical protein